MLYICKLELNQLLYDDIETTTWVCPDVIANGGNRSVVDGRQW